MQSADLHPYFIPRKHKSKNKKRIIKKLVKRCGLMQSILVFRDSKLQLCGNTFINTAKIPER